MPADTLLQRIHRATSQGALDSLLAEVEVVYNATGASNLIISHWLREYNRRAKTYGLTLLTPHDSGLRPTDLDSVFAGAEEGDALQTFAGEDIQTFGGEDIMAFG